MRASRRREAPAYGRRRRAARGARRGRAALPDGSLRRPRATPFPGASAGEYQRSCVPFVQEPAGWEDEAADVLLVPARCDLMSMRCDLMRMRCQLVTSRYQLLSSDFQMV